MEITIDKLSYGGAGIGRLDGKVYFVDGGIPGDVLKIKVVEEKGSFNRAAIDEIVTPSVNRAEPECEYFKSCGGCCWQDINYKTQLSEKEKIVADSLERIGRIKDFEMENIVPSSKVYGYRNRVLLSLFKENGEYRIGYFEENSNTHVSVERCVIASDEINAVIASLIDCMNENKFLSIPFNKVYLLSSENKVSISFLQEEKSHKSESQEILQKIIDYVEANLEDISLDHKLEFDFAGYRFTSSPYLFNQANYEINSELVKTVADWTRTAGKNSLLDLYCGIGNFSIALSGMFQNIIGVDSSAESIKLARRNAEINDLDNVTFIHEKCRRYIEKIKEAPDILLADPPRNGMKDILPMVSKLLPKDIIYISCNPTTLARDLKFLREKGYKINKLKPFDMFPQTYHVEAAVWLEYGS